MNLYFFRAVFPSLSLSMIVFVLGCRGQLPRPVILEALDCQNDPDNASCVTHDLVAPALSIKTSSQSSVTFEWTDLSAAENGYRILSRDADAYIDQPYALVAELGPNAITYTDSTVSANANYEYIVEVYKGNEKMVSNPVLVNTHDHTDSLPAAPSQPDVQFIKNQQGHCKAKLLWMDNSTNETSFEGWIDIFHPGNDVTSPNDDVNFSGTPQFDMYGGTGLREVTLEPFVIRSYGETRIQFKIRAHGSEGFSASTNLITVTGHCN